MPLSANAQADKQLTTGGSGDHDFIIRLSPQKFCPWLGFVAVRSNVFRQPLMAAIDEMP